MRSTIIITLLILIAYSPTIADTPIPGGSINGATWTVEGSPYIVNGNVKIEDLIIEPGVEVLFTGNFLFEVVGILVAEGFYNDSIFFKPKPEYMDGWAGIEFRSGAEECRLAYCRIEGSREKGVYIDSSTPSILNCRISDNDNDGIYIKNTSLQLKHCILSYNGDDGISLEASTLVAVNCIFTNNVKNGIRSTKSEDNITAVNSVIAHNQDKGIDCRDGDLTLTNCIVYHNSTQIRSDNQNTLVSYSDIEGNEAYPGEENIYSDPDFVYDLPYNLSSLSECIDAGNPGIGHRDYYIPPSQGTVHNDMGAYGGPEASGWFPPVYLKPQDLAYGPVTKDSSVSIEIKAFNYRETPLSVNITTIGQDSSYFVPEPEQFNLSVLDSTDITVTFTPDAETFFEAEMVFQTSGHGRVTMALTGTGVLPHLNLLTSEIHFGPVTLGVPKQLPLLIQNTGTAALEINPTLLAQENTFIIDPEVIVLQPGSAVDTIWITFLPDSAILFVDSLLLRSNDPLQLETTIQLSGTGIGPSLAYEPKSINYGEVNVGTDTVIYITMSNTGNDILEIQKPEIASLPQSDNQFKVVDSLTTFPHFLPPESIYKIPVKFSPTKSGLANDLLIIKSNDFVNDSVTIDLSGVGISPAINISQQNLEFGHVPIGEDSTQFLMITNTGNTQLVIDSLRINEKSSFHLVDPPADGVYLKPDSILNLAVVFSPNDTIDYPSSLNVYSNDPVYSSISIVLHGNGIASEIHISGSSLDYGSVLIGKDSIRIVVITNHGNANLVIDSLRVKEKSSPFHLSGPPGDGVEIDPDTSLELFVIFSPEEAIEYITSLFVYSNDPFSPLDSLSLSGSGYSEHAGEPSIQVSDTLLDFGDIELDSLSNRILTVYNQGFDTLVLLIDSLLISGQDSESFRLSKNYESDIALGVSDSVIIPMIFQPIHTGPLSASLRIVSNDLTKPSIDVAMMGNAHEAAPVIIRLDTLNSTIPFAEGEPGNLDFSISSSHTVDSAYIHIRAGDSKNYIKMPLYYQSGTNIWSIQINSTYITANGVEYFVTAYQSETPVLFPDQSIKEYNSIIVTVDNVIFPYLTQKSAYQMISIPLDTKGQTLSDLFSDNLGPYNNQTSRIFDCVDGTGYVERTEMSGTLPPGKALWLITRESVRLDISDGQSVATDEDFEISLQKGWNMIASPYSFPVDWQGISDQLVLREYIDKDWGFASVLQPFKGYAVNVPGDTVISIPPHRESMQKKRIGDNTAPFPFSWYIQISVKGEDLKDHYNYVGVNSAAQDDIDQFDYPEPPPIGEYISLSLRHGEQQALYSTDVRKTGMEGYRFALTLESNISGMKSISLRPSNLPGGFDWMLISLDEKVIYRKSNISIRKKQGNFELLVGNSDFLSEASSGYQSIPLTFQLSQNYPNPFNPLTSLKFQLPEAQKVTAIIYNVLGQRITYLLQEEFIDAGYHQLEWNGRDKYNYEVSSGIYFLHFMTAGYEKTMKMILQR